MIILSVASTPAVFKKASSGQSTLTSRHSSSYTGSRQYSVETRNCELMDGGEAHSLSTSVSGQDTMLRSKNSSAVALSSSFGGTDAGQYQMHL
jgi:hypothetical protein